MVRLLVAGAAALAMLALLDVARPDTPGAVLGSGGVRLADVGRQLPQTPPGLSGGFAADDSDDQAQQQEQLDLQEMQQAQQQAEEQNEQAEQQFEQGMQQAQMDEQQANNP